MDIIQAIKARDWAIVSRLIFHDNVDLDCIDSEGVTPLMHAVIQKADKPIIEALLLRLVDHTRLHPVYFENAEGIARRLGNADHIEVFERLVPSMGSRTCFGCLHFQAAQEAHMYPGGCLEPSY